MSTKAEDKKSWYEANKEKVAEYNREWRKNNKLKVKAQNARYREKNRESLNEKCREYSRTNRESINATKRAYKKKNPVVHRESRMRRYAQKIKAVPPWFDRVQVKAFYIHARFMTEQTGVPHEVDHIVPLRSEFVCGLHCHQNLQVITQAENRKKNNRYWPDMMGVA